MATDPYFDCPVCELTRLENPCEHCGHLYVPKVSVDNAHSVPQDEGMNLIVSRCVLNHDRYGLGVRRCGQVATHLVEYPGWGNALPSCGELAAEAIDHGATVVHVDALFHAGFISKEQHDAIREAHLSI